MKKIKSFFDSLTEEGYEPELAFKELLAAGPFAERDEVKSLIEKYVDEEVMEKIADAYREGRVLNIGTANLDSMRPVIWRIGAIANAFASTCDAQASAPTIA